MSLVLIADDNNESRYLLEVLLEQNGFQTVTATNGKEALEKARAHRPDLIVADILMPVMDGFALCKAWKSDEELKQIPFIFYTATYTEPKDIEFGLSLGADKFLIKPQEIDVLLQVFLEVLSRSGTATEVGPESSLEEEMEFLRQHNEVLFRKLEKKMADLEAVNRSLQGEIRTRHLAERSLRQSEKKLQSLLDALQKAHDELEQRVAQRTAELSQAYKKLETETAERANLEEQLRQSQKMEALGTLAGGIAHDFNNILAVMIGFTELVKDKQPKGSLEERRLQMIIKAGLRGREVIRRILTFSYQMPRENKPLRLSGIVNDTLKFLRASIPSTISIRTKVEAESHPILGDLVEMQQVLMNLCTNAAHAMRERGGTLDVEVSDYRVMPGNAHVGRMEPGLYTRLVVRDTGVGIAPEIKDKIFDPYFTTKKVGEGTGLGLSTVLGIIKQSHGSITVESAPGKGSTFTVYFPQVEEEGTIDEIVTGEPIPTGSERILFVDDEALVVMMGEGLLRELGYEVTSKTTSREALEVFRNDPFRFDLVITDQTMPDITGVELAKEILAIRPAVPVILCTGYSHLVDDDSARAAGIKGFAMKPLTKGEIARTVRKVLENRN